MRIWVDAAVGRGLIAIAPENVAPFTLSDPEWSRVTSNWLEHKAIFLGLRLAQACYGSEAPEIVAKAKQIQVISDSQLAVRQLSKEYKTKALSLKPVVSKTQELVKWMESHGQRVRIDWTPREKNPAGILLG